MDVRNCFDLNVAKQNWIYAITAKSIIWVIDTLYVWELFPLSKKLRLGSIKVQLVEQISVFFSCVGTKTFEGFVPKKKVSDPLVNADTHDEKFEWISWHNVYLGVVAESHGEF